MIFYPKKLIYSREVNDMSIRKPEAESYTKVSLVLSFLRGSIRYFIISIISALCVTGLDMLSPQLIRTTVDCILGDNELPGFMINLIDYIGGIDYLRSHLWLIGCAIVILAVFSGVFRYMFMLFNTKGAESLVESMRDRLFAHIQRLPFSWHSQNQTGDIIQRCTSDVDMIKNFGISYRTAGENIAQGYRTPEAVMNGWMNSSGHRANILNASYTQIGVGYVADGNYWTQMFIG